ncbi:MAG: hypothetical protein ACXIU7_05700 [Roseinatronobacter sp.]
MRPTPRITITAFAALTLAACGAGAPPSAPDTPPPGLSISGEARLGVTTRL